MFDPCCDDVIGGEITITARFGAGGAAGAAGGASNNTETYEGMGEVRLQPSKVSRASGASSGGTVWITESARPIRLIMNYVNRCSKDPMRIFMERCQMDITVVEKSRAVWHFLTGALAVGDVEKNLSTGEISGMEIVAQKYRTRRANQAANTAGNLVPLQSGA